MVDEGGSPRAPPAPAPAMYDDVVVLMWWQKLGCHTEEGHLRYEICVPTGIVACVGTSFCLSGIIRCCAHKEKKAQIAKKEAEEQKIIEDAKKEAEETAARVAREREEEEAASSRYWCTTSVSLVTVLVLV